MSFGLPEAFSDAIPSPRILEGQIMAFFAFDIGYEVSLDEVGRLLASNPKQPISRKKRTPNYLQYTHAPHVHPMGETDVSFDHAPGVMQATIFDFGAISIAYRWPFPAEDGFPIDQLPHLSKKIYDMPLEQHAKAQVQLLMQQIQPTITRPEFSELVEDFYIFIIEKLDELDGEPITAERLLDDHAHTLAQALHFDTEPLSELQRKEALARVISYYERDLVLIDWNAAIIYDTDYTDTLNVLELLNVELLEARYIDAQLDKRIKNYERLSQRQPAWFMPLSIPYRQSINELAELRIESSVLAERVDNALKLIGDLYLARIYSEASQRFYLPTWDASISRKLDIIGNLYQILTERVNSSQAQLLELIIIVLILIEIFLSLSQHLK
jgi:hypothetical protein